jgi:hypothetical protein
LVDTGFFDLRWSSLIIDDACRWILKNRPSLNARDLHAIWEDVYDAYPEATVLDEEARQTAEQLKKFELDDLRSRELHILAAAVTSEVDSIVTTHVAKASIPIYGKFGIAVLSLDMLLCQCWKHNEYLVLQTFIEQAVERSYSPSEMFNHLVYPLYNDAPEFVLRVIGTYTPDETVLRMLRRFLE